MKANTSLDVLAHVVATPAPCPNTGHTRPNHPSHRMEPTNGIETPDAALRGKRHRPFRRLSWCIARTLTFNITAAAPGESCAAPSAIVYLNPPPAVCAMRKEENHTPANSQPARPPHKTLRSHTIAYIYMRVCGYIYIYIHIYIYMYVCIYV